MALPIMVGFAFYPVYTFVSVALLGQRSEDATELVSFGLMLTVCGIVLESIGIGMTSCVEALIA